MSSRFEEFPDHDSIWSWMDQPEFARFVDAMILYVCDDKSRRTRGVAGTMTVDGLQGYSGKLDLLAAMRDLPKSAETFRTMRTPVMEDIPDDDPSILPEEPPE